MAKAKFKVGQVVAYRRDHECIYRYGRIHAEEGLLLESDGAFRPGYRVLDGIHYETIKGSHLRKLTRRERGGA